MLFLGIETSCDETSVAIVDDQLRVLSSVTNSQVDLHGPYGGVVPEIASRRHVEMLPLVLSEAIARGQVAWSEIDAIAVTYGPGLASSLLVGLGAAKGLAMRLSRPLFPVNHLQGHMFSPFLSDDAPTVEAAVPFVSLVVSGGHTCLVEVRGVGDYRLLGQTIDDAAGEAFDKGANLLDLGYPGGAVIDRLSREGDRSAVAFPRLKVKAHSWRFDELDPNLCFSYSGLKTALLYHLKGMNGQLTEERKASVAASYQEAIIDMLVERTERALSRGVRTLAVGGGVSLNSRLRERLQDLTAGMNVQLLLTQPKYCADNAAMIAAVAALCSETPDSASLGVDITPSLGICDVSWNEHLSV